MQFAAYRGLIAEAFDSFKQTIKEQMTENVMGRMEFPMLAEEQKEWVIILTTEIIRECVYVGKGWCDISATKSHTLVSFIKRITP